MSQEYGDELVSVLARLRTGEQLREATTFSGPGTAIGTILRDLFAPTAPSTIVYFPPGRYILDRETQFDYVCPPHVQLFFAVNALLRIEDDVTLELQGSLRAGVQQIFGYAARDVKNRNETVDPPTGVRPTGIVTWSLDPHAGKVVITGDRIPFVRPEWWGSVSVFQAHIQGPEGLLNQSDYSEGLQAAINTACVGRAGLNPLPILLEGPYQCGRTLEVIAPPTPGTSERPFPVCLILRGKASMGTANLGTATIVRTRNYEAERLETATDAASARVLLRIHPGVDFDFENVTLDVSDNPTPQDTEMDRIRTCVEVLCDAHEPTGRRGVMRRVSLRGTARHQLRIVENGNSPTSRRQFVLDGCALAGTDYSLGDSALLVEAGDGVMVHATDFVAYAPSVPETVTSLTPDANLLLKGGSVLLEGALFHRRTGPRPSNGSRDSFEYNLGRRPDLDVPDGQDIYLDAPGSEHVGTHLTVIQCESQSWWFLGSGVLPPGTPTHSTVLMAVSHNNVNWSIDGTDMFAISEGNIDPEAHRYIRWWQEDGVPENGWVESPASLRGLSRVPQFTTNPRPKHPPSLVWRGRERAKCVLIGCMFGTTIALDDPDSVVDGGINFKDRPQMMVNPLFFRHPEAVIRRPYYLDRFAAEPLAYPAPSVAGMHHPVVRRTSWVLG